MAYPPDPVETRGTGKPHQEQQSVLLCPRCGHDLFIDGYVVLTAQQAEEVTALLGLIAFEDGDDRYGDEAERILSEWPDSNTDRSHDDPGS